MTSQGSLHNQFRRACQRRDLVSARMFAAQLPRITAGHALALLLVIRAVEPEKYSRAALRFHARFCRAASVDLEDAAALLSGLAGLAAPTRAAADVVAEICETYGVVDARRIVETALREPPPWPSGPESVGDALRELRGAIREHKRCAPRRPGRDAGRLLTAGVMAAIEHTHCTLADIGEKLHHAVPRMDAASAREEALRRIAAAWDTYGADDPLWTVLANLASYESFQTPRIEEAHAALIGIARLLDEADADIGNGDEPRFRTMQRLVRAHDDLGRILAEWREELARRVDWPDTDDPRWIAITVGNNEGRFP